MDEVHAKLWIIGRTYATGIERKVAGTGVQGGSLSHVATFLLAHGDQLDAILDGLQGCVEPLTSEALATILAAHGSFLHLLSGLRGLVQAPRSFASKYLHFHCPAVPIYDSYVNASVRRMYARQSLALPFNAPPVADPHYAWYVTRFWKLYQTIGKPSPPVTVKVLDHYLLSLA
ncbi:MAG: hypothetical protein HYX51_03280 [Chloroflexi bacterium]|nr:hypothetical protein [Chloroflexota bacterium]